jgi:hypothetical protein
MAIRDHVQRVRKLRGRVTTVDPSQRIVEVVTADGNAHRVYITDISAGGFVWPIEGEDWSIYEENGMWVLGNKFLNQDEAVELESLQPGDTYPPRFTIEGTPGDGDVATWDAGVSSWVAHPPAPGGGGDLSYTHNQVIAAATWNVNHGLGKFPSVTVIDSTGATVEGAVAYTDANNLTITFVSAFAGKAYLN